MAEQEMTIEELKKEYLDSLVASKPYIQELLLIRKKRRDFIEEKESSVASMGKNLSSDEFATKIGDEFAITMIKMELSRIDEKLKTLLRSLYDTGRLLRIDEDAINCILGLSVNNSIDDYGIILDNYSIIEENQEDKPTRGGR